MKALFAPFRHELDDCWCDPCLEINLLINDPLYGVCSVRQLHHQELAQKLLASCQSGSHVRKDFKTFIADSSESYLAGKKAPANGRGYASFKASDYYVSGMGLGMTPQTCSKTRSDRF